MTRTYVNAPVSTMTEDRIRHMVYQASIGNESLPTFAFESGDDFEAIVKTLADQYGIKLAERGVVTITPDPPRHPTPMQNMPPLVPTPNWMRKLPAAKLAGPVLPDEVLADVPEIHEGSVVPIKPDTNIPGTQWEFISLDRTRQPREPRTVEDLDLPGL